MGGGYEGGVRRGRGRGDKGGGEIGERERGRRRGELDGDEGGRWGEEREE